MVQGILNFWQMVLRIAIYDMFLISSHKVFQNSVTFCSVCVHDCFMLAIRDFCITIQKFYVAAIKRCLMMLPLVYKTTQTAGHREFKTEDGCVSGLLWVALLYLLSDITSLLCVLFKCLPKFFLIYWHLMLYIDLVT